MTVLVARSAPISASAGARLWSRKACRLQALRHLQGVEWDRSWLGFLMQLEPTNPSNAG
jgi:hypothetical protein